MKGLLDGGTDTEVFADICAGDVLTMVGRVANLETRKSRSLGVMLIQTVENTFTDERGEVVAIQRRRAIFY